MTVLKQTHRRTPSDNSTVSFESAEGEPAAVEEVGAGEDEERQAAHVVAQVVAEPDDKEVSLLTLFFSCHLLMTCLWISKLMKWTFYNSKDTVLNNIQENVA